MCKSGKELALPLLRQLTLTKTPKTLQYQLYITLCALRQHQENSTSCRVVTGAGYAHVCASS